MLTSYTELPLEDLTLNIPSFEHMAAAHVTVRPSVLDTVKQNNNNNNNNMADIESAGTFLDLSMLAM